MKQRESETWLGEKGIRRGGLSLKSTSYYNAKVKKKKGLGGSQDGLIIWIIPPLLEKKTLNSLGEKTLIKKNEQKEKLNLAFYQRKGGSPS